MQEGLGRDPFAGDVFFFRGRSGSLIKAIWHDGVGLSLYAKRLDRGRFVWPQTVDGTVSLTAGQVSYLLEGIDWVRRITGGRQRVEVPYDEGVANRIDPESCVDGREAAREALTGARVGQALSDETLLNRGADALQSAEGNTYQRVSASTGRPRVVCRPWHARTSLEREPRGLRPAHRSRVMGRTVKAGSRRP